MLAGYAREKEVERRALMTRLRHLWAAMDHPDGKKGLAFAPFGEIKSGVLLREKETGSKFALVNFRESDGARLALRALAGLQSSP